MQCQQVNQSATCNSNDIFYTYYRGNWITRIKRGQVHKTYIHIQTYVYVTGGKLLLVLSHSSFQQVLGKQQNKSGISGSLSLLSCGTLNNFFIIYFISWCCVHSTEYSKPVQDRNFKDEVLYQYTNAQPEKIEGIPYVCSVIRELICTCVGKHL